MSAPIRLRLYLAGRTASAERARAAIDELEQLITAKMGPGAVVAEIVDALSSPEAAARDQVFATPTLIRLSPAPVRRLFGDLANVDKIVAALELDAAGPTLEAILELPDCESLAGVA